MVLTSAFIKKLEELILKDCSPGDLEQFNAVEVVEENIAAWLYNKFKEEHPYEPTLPSD